MTVVHEGQIKKQYPDRGPGIGVQYGQSVNPTITPGGQIPTDEIPTAGTAPLTGTYPYPMSQWPRQDKNAGAAQPKIQAQGDPHVLYGVENKQPFPAPNNSVTQPGMDRTAVGDKWQYQYDPRHYIDNGRDYMKPIPGHFDLLDRSMGGRGFTRNILNESLEYRYTNPKTGDTALARPVNNEFLTVQFFDRTGQLLDTVNTFSGLDGFLGQRFPYSGDPGESPGGDAPYKPSTQNGEIRMNEEVRLKSIRENLRKDVQMMGTAQRMPVTQERYPSTVPPNREWEMEVGRRQDEEVEAARQKREALDQTLANAQNQPQNQLTRRTTVTTRTEEFGLPSTGGVPSSNSQYAEESGPVDPINPMVLSEAPRKEDESETHYIDRLRGKVEALHQREEELPPPAQGAEPLGTSGGVYDPQTEGRVNPMFGGTTGRMEEPSEAQLMGANPRGKLPAEPGRSGSSGVYNTGSSIISLDHVPTLQKGFTAMNRVLKTYCQDCGVAVDEEGGDKAHFEKTRHSHFRKI